MSLRPSITLAIVLFVFSFVAQGQNPPPALNSIAPVTGSVNGGTPVTLSGSNFLSGATVTFGSVAADDIVVVNNGTITATTPAHAAGPVIVTVTNPDGQSASLVITVNPVPNPGFELGSSGWLQSGSGTASVIPNNPSLAHSGNNFLQLTSQPTNHPTYNAILTNSSSPQFLPVTPGDVITFGGWTEHVSGDGHDRWVLQVTDANLANSTYVTTASATSSTWTLFQQTYTVPAGKAFIRFYCEVYLNTVQAQANFDDAILQQQTAVGGYTYQVTAPLSITSISPASGSVNGGNSVTISGANFQSGATVQFGNTAASNVVFVNSTTITANAPSNSAGAVSVIVTNPDGQTSGIQPLANPGFETGTTGAGWVFGGSGTFSVIANSSQAHSGNNFAQITSAPGNHPVLSAVLSSGNSQYLPVNPGDMITFGGWVERVSGNGSAHWVIQLTDTNKANPVYAATTNVTSSSWTFFQNKFVVPTGKAFLRFYSEIYNNSVQAQANFDDAVLQQQPAAATYTYLPPPTLSSITPTSGSTAGGTSVTLSGSSFVAGATVSFGASTATGVSVINASTITAITPASTAGAVNVTVTNPDGDSSTATNAYTYVTLTNPPVLNSVSPASGPVGGGTSVTLSGTNFLSGAAVTFGSIAATNVTVVNSTTITAFTPANSAGPVSVTVTNPGGQSSTLNNAYVYNSAPSLNSVSPAFGSISGGTAVTLSGANFGNGATVQFGSAAASNVVVVNSNTITATAPPSSGGAVGVTVTNPDGQTSGIQPLTNPGFEVGTTGTGWVFGTTGKISVVANPSQAHSGNNFAQLTSAVGNHPTAAAVLASGNSQYFPVNPGDMIIFGGWIWRVSGDGSAQWDVQVTDGNKANPTYVSSGNATASAWTFFQKIYSVPAGKAFIRFYCEIFGNTVQAQGNFDDAVLIRIPQSAVFTYITNPSLSWIGPNSGPANSANSVTISGANFFPGATVSFGGAQATNVTVVNSTTITATTPAQSAGSVVVTVTNPGGLAGVNSVTYTFNAPPFISSVSPASGPPAGGSNITISGGNFLPGAKVTLGGTPALNVSTSPGSITATTPPGSAGLVDVVITDPDGESVSSAAFTYQQPPPSISGISPASGSTNGGNTVMITGANFLAPMVTFGGTAGTVTFVSSTTILVVTPANASSGPVAVTVMNSDSQTNTVSGGFTYVSPTATPTVTSLSSTSGSTSGGASITINGTNFVSGATVTFGTTPATNVSVVNSSTITASTPAHGPGTVNVTVTNPDGQSATLFGIVPLLPNPSFELGSTDWQFAGTGTAVVNNDPTNAESGTHYALVTSNAGGPATYNATDASGSNEYFPVVAGDVISFGGGAYRLSGDGQANYTLVVTDSSKNTLTTLTTTPNNASTPVWANLLGSYTVPTGAAFVKFAAQIVNNTVTAQARFDAAILQRTPAGGGYTYVGLSSPGSFTYNYDNMRTGQNPNETILTPANVNFQTFGKKFTYSLDGWVHAQPLYVANVLINGSRHNVLYVATEHDSVYAFDADGAQSAAYWQTSFINPAAGVTTIPTGDLVPSGINQPEFGVMATPVIDPVAGTIFVLARTLENGNFVQRLHALDITNGAERHGSPVLIQASVAGTGSGSSGGQLAYSSRYQNVRPGMVLANGTVYFGAASLNDLGPYHGWVLGYDATNLTPSGVFNVTPNGFEGGIWSGGGGIGADAAGNLYVQTGNGTFDANQGGQDYGDGIVKLQLSPAGLNPVDYFTPFDQGILQSQDLDISSGNAVLLPDQPGPHVHELIGGGKQGTIYVLDRDAMGGYNASGDTQIVQELRGVLSSTTSSLDAGLWSTPIYWNNLIFMTPRQDVIKVFSLQNGLLTGPIYKGTTTKVFVNASISSNGVYNPILWVAENNGARNLRALDPYDVTQEYYNSNQAGTRDVPGAGISKFMVPVVVNGKVYIAGQGELDVYSMF
jgi:IPT/TIG domain-containing protein